MKKRILLLSMITLSSFMLSQAGINTANPDPSAALHVEANNKGFLLPRVVLTSINDGTTIPNPANGLIVYHTNNMLYGEGIYVNSGTSSTPEWSLLQKFDTNNGSTTAKVSYAGAPDPTKVIGTGNLDIRLIVDGSSLRFQMKRKTAPSSDVTYYANRVSWFNNTVSTALATITFTSSNWDQWQNFNSPAYINSGIFTYSYLIHISSLEDPIFYEAKYNMRYGGPTPIPAQMFFSTAFTAN